jgi:hypothetical protein
MFILCVLSCIFSETETVIQALRFVGFGTSFSHEEYKIVRILRCNIFMDFEKCKTVWEGFEHSANWFNKVCLLSPILQKIVF